MKEPKPAIIAILFIIIIAAAAVYLLFLAPQPKDFETGYSELKALWANNDININFSAESLAENTNAELLQLKSDLESYKSSISLLPQTTDSKALASLSGLYLTKLQVAKALKDFSEASAAYEITGEESDAEICNLLPTITASVEASENLSNWLSTYAEDVNSFISAYPEQSETALLTDITAGAEESQDSTLYQQELLETIRGGCGA